MTTTKATTYVVFTLTDNEYRIENVAKMNRNEKENGDVQFRDSDERLIAWVRGVEAVLRQEPNDEPQ